MSKGEFDDYFRYDVWAPKTGAKAQQAPAKKKGMPTGPNDRLFLPARFGEVKLANKGWDDNVFSVCQPIYSDGITSTSHGDRRFAPGTAVPLAEDGWEEELAAPSPIGAGAASEEQEEPSVEAATPLVDELLATLEARDGPAFERVREELNTLVRKISVSQVGTIEELLSARLGPTWAEFVAEDPEAAELFRHAHIGPAQVVEVPKQETSHAKLLDWTELYYGTLSAGLHLGPRYRTRQVSTADMKFRPTGHTGWQF